MQFSHFFEQYDLINSLIKIADQGRVSHAQLFYGDESSGAFAICLAYAQYLNCTNKQRFESNTKESLLADSCGECPSCKKYSKLIHPDLHFIFPNTTTKKIDSKNSSILLMNEFRDFILKSDGYIKLDDWYSYLDIGNKQGQINVRDANDIIAALNVKSYEAKFKIMIIWAVDKLNYDAAPKLLKILEEPYEKTLFFLITQDRENILPTILSRTQLIKVPNKYSKYKEKELPYLNLFVEWMRNCFQVNSKISEIMKVVEDISKLGREEEKQFLNFTLDVFQKCFIVKMGLTIDDNPLNNCEQKFRDNFPNFITEKNIEKIYKEIEDAILHVERNGNAKIVFLDLSIKLGFLLINK